MTPFRKGKTALAGLTRTEGPGENITFQDFLGPNFWTALDSLVDALPHQGHSLKGHQHNSILVRDMRQSPVAFLHPQDLLFKSGEKVLVCGIDEELCTVTLTLISLDLTAPSAVVKVHAACETDWNTGQCMFVRLRSRNRRSGFGSPSTESYTRPRSKSMRSPQEAGRRRCFGMRR